MNYYELLEVMPTASIETIQAAYRAAAKKYHPDTYDGDKKSAETRMKQLNEAIEIFENEDKRKEYNRIIGIGQKKTSEQVPPKQDRPGTDTRSSSKNNTPNNTPPDVLTAEKAKELSGEHIDIPDKYKIIAEKAFSGRENLISVTIPDSVKFINPGAFEYCKNLTNIEIPEGITSIEKNTFHGCTNLIGVNLSGSITSIGQSAFKDCESLKLINIANNSIKFIRESAFEGCINLNTAIPDNAVKIEKSAFMDCISLQSIKIPGSITSIEESVFENCINLREVIIPDSVTRIGSRAFFNCEKLSKIFISNSIASIGRYSFACFKSSNFSFEHILILTDNLYVYEYCKKYDLKVKSLKEEIMKKEKEKEETEKKAQSRIWQKQGLCKYDGGKLSFFMRKCKSCGRINYLNNE
ncbi:MAG: leucine-rich repeat protein [Oscillospiraceae bacterium]|nr:leucine-rich repeat protein [Oscillospiraceae bacterium]